MAPREAPTRVAVRVRARVRARARVRKLLLIDLEAPAVGEFVGDKTEYNKNGFKEVVRVRVGVTVRVGVRVRARCFFAT